MRFRSQKAEFHPLAQFVGFEAEYQRAGHRVSDTRESGLSDSTHRSNTLGDVEDGQPTLLDDRQLQVSEFEQRLSKTPGDASVWLAYAHSHDDGRVGQRAQLEVTLAILDRALKVVPIRDRVPVVLDQLATAETLWKPEQVEVRWQEILDEMERVLSREMSMVDDMMSIWVAYLEWIEGLGFGRNGRTVDNVISTYENIFERLHRYCKWRQDFTDVTDDQPLLPMSTEKCIIFSSFPELSAS